MCKRMGIGVVALLSLLVVGCATVPDAPSREHVDTAKRFLHISGMSDLGMVGLNRQLDAEAKTRPALAEFLRRALADVKKEDLEELLAPVWAKYLEQRHLASLADFAAGSTGQRLFKTIFAKVAEGEKSVSMDLLNQFNADELTQIMKFSQSEAMAAMKQALPEINRETTAVAHRFGEEKLRAYLDRNN